MNGSHLFIADLHLNPEPDPSQGTGVGTFADPDLLDSADDDSSPEARQTAELALRFLQQAHGQQHLYILGDLFEYWLGDDAGLPLHPSMLAALRAVSDSGCKVSVMLGNRDFLLGQTFAEAAGVTLIRDDEHIITLGSEPVLLMHGDTLCTDDNDYQRFRRNVREPRWQQQFLAKSVDERRHHAEALRAASHDASVSKSAVIMDVNVECVSRRLQATGCQTLIHGHTHRPAVHEGPSAGQQRLVVGDWHPDYAQYVEWDGTDFQLKTFR
ncbi:UDP-2,3-diacylglucosamine diphosphatase [Granulosicoccus sp. 3-233]|uniref:UDP-2,3-diacylglucosamine diphosphatase n=1 Tax=Granulosicoccus sp. 3-233 TaxID=3417969 RepID=UPI003D339661